MGYYGLVCCFIFFMNISLSIADKGNALKCLQGFVWKDKGCVECPANTYWKMIIANGTEVTGATCEGCPQWFESPAGSIDYTKCICNSQQCTPEPPKTHNLPIIITIIGVIVGLALIVVGLVYCKMYGQEFLRQFINKEHMELSQTDDESLLNSSPPPQLPEVQINLPDEQIDDAYNDVTQKGDINDLDAVVRAAVISEKRRSRCYSMSSMTDLSVGGRYRTVSMNSATPSNYGIDKSDTNKEVSLPLPDYDTLMQQNNRTTQF